MSEVNSGLRSILKYGWVYRLSQSFFGEKKSKQFIIDQYLLTLTNNTVLLDMGCGAGNFAYFIPENIHYIGFDPNENYIEDANEKFKHQPNFKFYAGTAASKSVNDPIADASVDYALIHGVLHHLSDDEIVEMYRMAERVLKPGGKMVSLEPVWYEGQSPVNRHVMSMDRGKNIKQKSQWLKMAHENTDAWAVTQSQIYSHLIRFYDLIIIDSSKNQQS